MGDGEGLTSLLAYVNEHRGIDFALYRHATVMRKLDLRLQATKTSSHAAYLEYLKSHPVEIEDLIGALTIKVTSFFRDPPVFELLSSRVIPEVMSRFGSLRMWSLGCASGEEPYSLAIIVRDILKRETEAMKVEIVGTDIDAAAIGKAMRRDYPEREIAEVGEKYVEEFFEATGGPPARDRTYRISDQIGSMVRFESDDIISGLKRAKSEGRLYHVILCRNVLIYMNRALQEEVVADISGVLCDGGYVVIGESETLPANVSGRFTRTCPGLKIYCRKSLFP
jgi:chemotaxis protein methyltransferase CheR